MIAVSRIRTPLSCVLLSGLALSVAACGNDDATAPEDSVQEPPAPLVEAHLLDILGVMQRLSLHRLTIDWQDVRERVLEDAADARAIADLDPTISLALRLLDDHHSYYVGPDGKTILGDPLQCSASPVPEGTPELPAGIGYVRVGTFTGNNRSVDATTYIKELQQQLVDADLHGVTRWIVDLRGNMGGNMWPMLAGIGPVLGEGVAGHFVSPIGSISGVWEYRDGAARLFGNIVQPVTNPYHLYHPRIRVAVLLDGRVANSGEATAIAFRGRSETRFFGTPTCGLSTALTAFTLANDAQLHLTTAWVADRNRAIVGDTVFPDEFHADPEATVAAAVAWLLEETGAVPR